MTSSINVLEATIWVKHDVYDVILIKNPVKELCSV